jgi:ABC-type uncharacterized transport system permease subunit
MMPLAYPNWAIGSFSSKSLNKADSILFFLYDPLPRVLSASGVIMRFKKKIVHGALVRDTLRPITLIPIQSGRKRPRSDTAFYLLRQGSNPRYVLQSSCKASGVCLCA